MNIMKLSARRMVYAAIAAALAIAVIVPALTGAAQVTDRSIALSSSSTSATSVTYTVNFTADQAAGAFVVDFCSNSPVLGQACDAPTGFDVGTPTSTTTGFDDVALVEDDSNNNTLRVTGSIAEDANVSVEIDGLTNPDEAGPLYARIATFTNPAAADSYTSTSPDAGSNLVDDGGVAISITPTIGVSGSVLESMTFCVSGETEAEENPIGASCSGTLVAPNLELGEESGDTVALNANNVSTGTLHTQISTNAASGAVVWLKSSALDCGGLMRAGAPEACDISPALADGITAGQARFGVMTAAATATDGVTGASGTYQPVDGSGYNDSTYALNYVDGNATGVTSPFGDEFLDTAGAPVNNQNMALNFGASVGNNTPAGDYSTDLSLIATGKF